MASTTSMITTNWFLSISLYVYTVYNAIGHTSRLLLFLSVERTEPSTDTQGLSRLRVGQIPANQVMHMYLHCYVIASREIGGDARIAQCFRRHIFQMNRAIDPPRLFSIDESHRTPDQHFFEIQPRPRQVDHHGRAWPSVKIPILVRVTRGRNADLVGDSQEPHGQEMDTPIIIECREVRDERHRKELVDPLELRTMGLFAAASGERLVIFLVLLLQ